MSLSVAAPTGAHFEEAEVKAKLGSESLGNVPVLVWDDVEAMIEYYGNEGVCDIANGTSLRTTFMGIARRLRANGKSDDEIAENQIKYRPGKRVVAGTPQSRVRNAAQRAFEALGENSDRLTALLDRIAAGEIPAEVLD